MAGRNDKPITANDNELNFEFDQYTKPNFDPSLQQTIAITEGYNFLDEPSNLDLIQLDLIDQYDNTVTTIQRHISDIEGLRYENEQLHIDTFDIVTKLFNKISGRYKIKVSGFRNYIHDEIEDPSTADENDNLEPDDDGVEPFDIIFGSVEVVEFSRSRKEVRVKSDLLTDKSLDDFLEKQTPRSIPFKGLYWKYEDKTALPGDPMHFNPDGVPDPKTSLRFTSDAAYDKHREARGLPYGDGNDNRWNGNITVDADHKFVRYMRDVPEGRRLESSDDIWPVTLRLTKPAGGFVELISTNWMEHTYTPKATETEKDPASFDTAIFRLATPAPKGISAGSRLQILRALFVPFELPIEIDVPYILDEAFTELRGPNLRIDIAKNASKGTITKNEIDLTGTNDGIKQRLEKGLVSSSGLITTNVDYRKFENFVHFSNAQERLKNFKYKLTRIEHYESKSAAISTAFTGTDSSVTGSASILANKLEYDNLRRGILNSFNQFEQYMYYNSHSAEVEYTSNGVENFSPATWPKSLDTKTGVGYQLFSVTSSEAQAWYNGRIVSASIWDEKNQSALRNVIPTHIRVDEQSDSYQLFFDMIGEHFDDLYLQIKSLEEQYRRDESVDVGLSKDLLFDVAKSFGWDLYPGHSTTDLWEYALGTDSSGTYQASGSNETKTFVVKESHSSEDIEKQTWKRLLNNLPLLLKTKGTARGVRALLTSYGIPLTILNIDEYGGAPASRAEDKREIQKFNYAVDFSGSAHVRTFHTFIDYDDPTLSLSVPGSSNRVLSMYEFRIDTSVTESMHLASSTEVAPGGERWVLYLEHSSSAAGFDSPAAIAAGSASAYAHYGRLTFYISGSAANPAKTVSTDYAPFYDNDWWNVSFGFTEHPVTGPNTAEIRYAKAAEHSTGGITYSGSANVAVTSTNMDMWKDSQFIRWGGSGSSGEAGSDFPYLQPFSGSWQEIRGWAEYISTDAFHQHALAATSIVGDTIQSAYNDLFLRIPLGTDLKTYDVSSPGTDLTFAKNNINGSIPNDANNDGWTVSFDTVPERKTTFVGWDSIPFSPKSETYFVKVPHTAGPSKHANKIRIENNSLRNNQLAREKSFEQSSFDSNPLDSEDLSVVLSPADQIDTDIAMQFGGFDLDDFIGDPRDRFKMEYTSLRDTKNLYFKKYSNGNSVMAFIKFLRSFNKGLFKQIEEMLPARADAIVGIEIRPNLLERHKLGQPVSASFQEIYHTGSISLVTSSDTPGEVINVQTNPGEPDYGTLTGTIGIGAAPSQQRSGSDRYYNLYEGSTYLRDTFGETTESAQLVTVLDSRRNFIENRIQIPTYNIFNRPPSHINKTGSGWVTVFEDNFNEFNNTSGNPSNAGLSYNYHLGHEAAQPENTWIRVAGNSGVEISVAGGHVTFGDNGGNDEWWGHSRDIFAYEPNTLYKMSITVSASLDTDNDNQFYAGFVNFIDTNKDGITTRAVSPTSGNAGQSSQNYFLASSIKLAENPGLGKEVTRIAYLGNSQTRAGNQNGTTSPNERGINRIKEVKHPMKGTYGQRESVFTHFAPMMILNHNTEDGTTRVSHMKVEALPGAYVDVQPQYDASPAQRRLVIDGTQMTSPDFNVGSAQTIDGGPVVEFQLVNPNIINVAPAPGRPIRPNRGPRGNFVRRTRQALGNIAQAPNNNLTVR